MGSEETQDQVFEGVLAVALELRAAGREDWLAVACADHPDYRERVAAQVDKADGFPSMLAATLVRDFHCGQVLGGRYKLEKRLGSGAMGVVYRAQDMELDRPVALKILRTDMTDPDEAVKRFLREAELMASVQHPAVITVHDRGHTPDDGPYIVMELLEGMPLGDLLEEARRQAGAVQSDGTAWLEEFVDIDGRGDGSYVRLVTGWVAELASGLDAVHKEGAMHRDIKPSNIFICKDGRPVLLDFGVGTHRDLGTLTREGAAIGTPAYMAPESLQENTPARPTLDVYGLTATLYHMLTLRPPYSGSATQVFAMIATSDPAPAASLRAGLPRDLQAILDKGMERRVRARYGSAAELESDLRGFLDYRPIAARPISPAERVLRRMFRAKLLQGAVLATVLVLAVLAGWGLQQAYLDARDARHNGAIQVLPPAFTVGPLTTRGCRFAEDRARLTGILDRAVESSPTPLTAHLLRASFRFDHGDLAGAKLDMQAIAGALNTAFARDLVERYPSAGAHAAEGIDLSGLAEPSGPEERYLLGYHLLRAQRFAEAMDVLNAESVKEIHHAELLRITCDEMEGLTSAQERQRAADYLDDLIRLEERMGLRTAGTNHIRSRLLIVMGQYAEALEAARASIRLAGRSYQNRLNAGWAAFRVGLFDEAAVHFELAMELAPQSMKPFSNRLMLHLELSEVEEAEALLERMPFADDDSGTAEQAVQLGRIETVRAIVARRSGDEVVAKEHASLALDHFAYAAELGLRKNDLYAAMAKTQLTGNEQALFIAMSKLLARDTTKVSRLQWMIDFMPATLDEDSTESLRKLFQAFYTAYSSGSQNPRKEDPSQE